MEFERLEVEKKNIVTVKTASGNRSGDREYSWRQG